MAFISSIPPERRASLRRLKAEFDGAFAAAGACEDRTSPAYLAADARYRAWIRAIDAVALALLDDIDACEAPGAAARPAFGLAPTGTEPADLARLFAGLDETRSAADLIGAAVAGREITPRSRAMGIVGDDRASRLMSRNARGGGWPDAAAERAASRAGRGEG